MLPSSTSYSTFPFKSSDDPLIFTLYSTTEEEDINMDHFYNHQTDGLTKWMINNDDFSEMIENMFDWNVIGTLNDGFRVFYIDNVEENMKEEVTEEMREENENYLSATESSSSEEIIVEEEEIIEMSGVSLYDLEMKFIEEGFVSHGTSGAYPFSENRQNRRENFSRDDREKCVKEPRKLDVQKSRDRKKAKKQLENRIQELGQEIHELKGKLSMQDTYEKTMLF